MTDINSIEVGSYKRNVEKWLHAMFLTPNVVNHQLAD